MPFTEIINRLKDYRSNSDNYILAVAQSNDEELEEIQTEQIDSGVNSDGERRTPEYADLTISIKQSIGQPTDRVTLRDTGDFQRSVYAIFINDVIEFDATDEKRDELIEKYGELVFGYTDGSLQFAIDLLKPPIVEDFRKRILL